MRMVDIIEKKRDGKELTTQEISFFIEGYTKGDIPTYKGTDHTREFVPLMIYSPQFKANGELPLRKTFADIGATVAENFAVQMPKYGQSFLDRLI